MSQAGAGGFDYARLVADALRGVARDVLRKVEGEGLVGEQHLYLSFRTSAPGVEVPSHLRKQFPEEMTIILQNQFWGLEVADEVFSVQLKFSGTLERLTVPFAALVAFADPSVPFGLRFESSDEGEKEASAPAPTPAPPGSPPKSDPTGDGKVVAFRSPRKGPGPERRDS
jgi:uncharacterized protein